MVIMPLLMMRMMLMRSWPGAFWLRRRKTETMMRKTQKQMSPKTTKKKIWKRA